MHRRATSITKRAASCFFMSRPQESTATSSAQARVEVCGNSSHHFFYTHLSSVCSSILPFQAFPPPHWCMNISVFMPTSTNKHCFPHKCFLVAVLLPSECLPAIHQYHNTVFSHGPILNRKTVPSSLLPNANAQNILLWFGSVQMRLASSYFCSAASVIATWAELIIELGIKLVSSLRTSQHAQDSAMVKGC